MMVSHATATLLDYCDCGIVLEGGQATFYDNLEEAIAKHEENMAVAGEPVPPRRKPVAKKPPVPAKD